MSKTRTLYQIREDDRIIGPRTVGARLRSRKQAFKAARALKRMGRDAYFAPINVNATEFDGNGRRI